MISALFIAAISSIEVPKFQYIYILQQGQEEFCGEVQNDFISDKESYKAACSVNPPILGGQEMCNAVVDSHLLSKCFYPEGNETINSILRQIDSSVEFAIIENTLSDLEQTIDFNNLPRKMDIAYFQHDLQSDPTNYIKLLSKSSFKGNPQSIFKFLKKSNSRKTAKSNAEVHIVGNIKDKVSSLSLLLNGLHFDVVDEDLDIDTLILCDAQIHPGSPKKIITNDFLISCIVLYGTSNYSIFTNILHTNSFQLFDYGTFYQSSYIGVLFYNDLFTIFEYQSLQYYFEIPYNIANKFGIITIADAVVFGTEPGFNFPLYFTFNLTFEHFYPYAGPDFPLMYEEGDYPSTCSVMLLRDESWVAGLRKPRIFINTDESAYIVDTTEIDEVATILYGEEPTKSPKPTQTASQSPTQSPKPTQTASQSPTQSPKPTQTASQSPTQSETASQSPSLSQSFSPLPSEKVEQPTEPLTSSSSSPDFDFFPDFSFKEDDIKSIDLSNFEDKNKAITDAFSDVSLNWDNEKDHVLRLSNTNLNLSLNMKESEYILFPSGTKINVESGNLNLVIPNKTNTLTISTNSMEDVKVSIKGGGSLKISPKDGDHSESVKFNSKMKLNSTFSIYVESNDVKSLVVDSVTFYKSNQTSPIQINARSDEGTIPVSINFLESRRESNATLSNTSISEQISVEQPASLTLTNVGLKMARMIINMSLDAGRSVPVIEGNLTESPNSFEIRNVEGNPDDDVDFVIIKAFFNCSIWESKLKLDQTVFNQKKCRVVASQNQAHLLDDVAQELAISKKGEKKKKKLSGGQIAGIVIGCIAAVALIVLIIFLVLKFKKKKVKENSASNSEYSVGL